MAWRVSNQSLMYTDHQPDRDTWRFWSIILYALKHHLIYLNMYTSID